MIKILFNNNQNLYSNSYNKIAVNNNYGIKTDLNNNMLNDTFKFSNIASTTIKRQSISFGQGISPKILALREIENLCCASCGKNMITEHEMQELINIATNETGEKLITALVKHKQKLPLVEQEVINRIVNLTKTFDDMTFIESLKFLARNPLDIIINGKRIKYVPSYDKLENTQEEVIKKVDSVVNKLTGCDLTKSNLKKDLKKVKTIIKSRNGDRAFKRKRFLQGIKNNVDNEINIINSKKYKTDTDKSNLTYLEAIYETAKKIPTSTTDPDAFIVKNSKKPLDVAVRNLFHSGIATMEHLHPQSDGGQSDMSNLVVECAKCNGDKGSIPLTEWLQLVPEMIINSQKQIAQIILEIKDGNIIGLDNYPAQVKDVLFSESGGLINLNIDAMNELHSKVKPQIINTHNKDNSKLQQNPFMT